MTEQKSGMPRKHEVKGGAQIAFEEKKKAAGAKNVGVYLNAPTVEALEYWRNITGFGATEIFNRVMANSKKRPKLFLDLIQFDFDKYHEVALELATQRSIDINYGVDDGVFEQLSADEIEAALDEIVRTHGAPKVIGTKAKK